MNRIIYSMSDECITYLSAMSEVLLERNRKSEEEIRKEREERLNNYPVQLTQVEFTDGMKKSFNIDRNHENSYFHITDKETGKRLCNEMIYVGRAFQTKESLLEELNDNDKPRYVIVSYVKEAKYTKAERKKYAYLTGDWRYDNCYAVLDRETMSLVWKSEERFGSSPTIRNNTMCIDSKYIFIPTMEKIFEKAYHTVITTRTKIIIETERNGSAKVIDTITGEISTME